MIYALILTTYVFGSFQKSPMAVEQTSTVGFTTEQACVNAGKVAKAGAVRPSAGEQKTVVTYLCVPLSV